MNDIPTIAANLRGQDNRICANPIFVVQQKVRIHNLEESDTYIWVGDHSGEEIEEEVALMLEEAEVHDHHHDGSTTQGYRKAYYRDEYQFVQPFFTEHGANEYLKINAHNLREPRIYVESGWRNEEWAMVREHLMEKTT